MISGREGERVRRPSGGERAWIPGQAVGKSEPEVEPVSSPGKPACRRILSPGSPVRNLLESWNQTWATWIAAAPSMNLFTRTSANPASLMIAVSSAAE
jgi:hypothetical protein